MSQKKKWNIRGPQKFFNVLNPIRNFVQKQIPVLKQQTHKFPNRPQNTLNFALGDPSKYQKYKPNPKLIQIISEGIGKIDGYTNFQGSLSARKAIAEFYQKENGIIVPQSDIYLTSGGSPALWLAISVLANPGDNFLFPKPGFPLSQVISKSLGIQIRFCDLKKNQNWQIDIQHMSKLIDKRTKFLLVNNPSNPLGSVWSQKHQTQIIEFCKKHNLPLVVDQIYEKMTFQKQFPTFVDVRNGVPILKCSGLTKRWLVPGWRFGWLILYGGSQVDEIRRGLNNLCDILLMPHTIIQSQLGQILNQQSNKEYIKSRMELIQINQKYLQEQLKQQKYCNVTNSYGALYTTINLQMDAFQNIKNSKQFISLLFLEENIIVFPGDFFFSESFFRIVLCAELNFFEEFILRFKRFTKRHIKKEISQRQS